MARRRRVERLCLVAAAVLTMLPNAGAAAGGPYDEAHASWSPDPPARASASATIDGELAVEARVGEPVGPGAVLPPPAAHTISRAEAGVSRAYHVAPGEYLAEATFVLPTSGPGAPRAHGFLADMFPGHGSEASVQVRFSAGFVEDDPGSPGFRPATSFTVACSSTVLPCETTGVVTLRLEVTVPADTPGFVSTTALIAAESRVHTGNFEASSRSTATITDISLIPA